MLPEGTQAAVHAVGTLPKIKVSYIVDSRTAIVTHRSIVSSCNVVLSGIDTKQLKVRQTITSPQIWHVTARTTDDEQLLKILTSNNPYDSIKPTDRYYIVEPISEMDVLKARAQYDAEQVAQPEQPAAK